MLHGYMEQLPKMLEKIICSFVVLEYWYYTKHLHLNNCLAHHLNVLYQNLFKLSMKNLNASLYISLVALKRADYNRCDPGCRAESKFWLVPYPLPFPAMIVLAWLHGPQRGLGPGWLVSIGAWHWMLPLPSASWPWKMLRMSWIFLWPSNAWWKWIGRKDASQLSRHSAQN